MLCIQYTHRHRILYRRLIWNMVSATKQFISLAIAFYVPFSFSRSSRFLYAISFSSCFLVRYRKQAGACICECVSYWYTYTTTSYTARCKLGHSYCAVCALICSIHTKYNDTTRFEFELYARRVSVCVYVVLFCLALALCYYCFFSKNNLYRAIATLYIWCIINVAEELSIAVNSRCSVCVWVFCWFFFLSRLISSSSVVFIRLFSFLYNILIRGRSRRLRRRLWSCVYIVRQTNT